MEDPQPCLPRNLDHARKKRNSTKNIPFDLTFEILSILPTKSIIRFQTVSKLWFSIIRSKEFVDAFLTRSKTRPRLLFTFKHFASDKRFIFSAPEHDNDEKSSPGSARHDMTISGFVHYIRSPPVNGFVCCTSGSSIAVCNPTTRQLVKLPDIESNEKDMHVRLGYDPVEDQYKVLVVMMLDGRKTDIEQEHFVFTLSSKQKEWRKIENTTGDTYHTVYGGICINGALYYGVTLSVIVKFDVRSEKMELLQASELSHITPTYFSTLLNYSSGVDYHFGEDLRWWILEDSEKHEWSNMTCVLPCDEWDDLLGVYVRSKEEIHTGKLMVVYPRLQSSRFKPFGVCFYYFGKGTTDRINMHGIDDDEFRRLLEIGKRTHEILTFSGYIENIRFL